MFKSFVISTCRYSTKADKDCLTIIPSPKRFPVLRILLPLILSRGGEKLHEYIDDQHKKYGPIFRDQIGPIKSIFVSDVELIKTIFANEGKYPKHVLPDSWLLYNKMRNYQRGLYFMDGDEWLKYRKILNHVMLKEDFSAKNIVTNKFFEEYLRTWLKESNDGYVTDLEARLYHVSLMFMISYLVGTPFVTNADLFMPRIRRLASVVREIFFWSVKLSVISINLAKSLNLKSWDRFVNAVDDSIQISSDLLDTVIDCNGDGIVRDMVEQGIPVHFIRNIVVDFIIAAGDTTATTTQWTLYLLAKHKSIQEELHEELNKNVDVEKSSLLKNVLKESMRLYPVAPFITRYMPRETQISNYLVQPDELISMSMYTCGRSEQYFPDANTFRPDRWDRCSQRGRYERVLDAFATLPYALGGRSCIGRKLAQAQMLTTLSKIISLYKLDVSNTVQIKLNLITVPSEPIRLRMRKRN